MCIAHRQGLACCGLDNRQIMQLTVGRKEQYGTAINYLQENIIIGRASAQTHRHLSIDILCVLCN